MDSNALGGMIFTLILTMLVGGFILLYPLSRRLGALLEAKAERPRAAGPQREEVALLAERVHTLEQELALLAQRQEFAEQLLAGERGSGGAGERGHVIGGGTG